MSKTKGVYIAEPLAESGDLIGKPGLLFGVYFFTTLFEVFFFFLVFFVGGDVVLDFYSTVGI